MEPFDGVNATWSNPSADCIASSNTLAVPAPTTPICTFGELAALRNWDQWGLVQGTKGNLEQVFKLLKIIQNVYEFVCKPHYLQSCIRNMNEDYIYIWIPK